MKIRVKKTHPEAIVPKFAREGDAAMDLFATHDETIEPGTIALVGTGIAMELPKGFAGLIWDKSSMPAKYGIKTMGGVLDSGYRGEIKVILTNLSQKPHKVEKGDKIAQILIQEVHQPEIELTEELSESERGEGGFGSTGRK